MSTEKNPLNADVSASSGTRPPSRRFEGKIASMAGDRLVMTSTDGKEHAHMLSASTKVTCDGKTCQSSDLKAGSRIRVTLDKEDRKLATRIEALDANPTFMQAS